MGLQFNAEEEIPQPKQQTTKQSTDAGAHQLADFDPGICQTCKKGRLVVVAELHPDPFTGSQPAGIADIHGFIIREHHFLSPNLAVTRSVVSPAEMTK